MVFYWLIDSSNSSGGVCWFSSPAAVLLPASSLPPTLRAPPTACSQHLARTTDCACAVGRKRAGTFQILSAVRSWRRERNSCSPAMSAEICCCLPFNVLERIWKQLSTAQEQLCYKEKVYSHMTTCSFKYTTTDSVLGSLLLTMALLHLLVCEATLFNGHMVRYIYATT